MKMNLFLFFIWNNIGDDFVYIVVIFVILGYNMRYNIYFYFVEFFLG